MDEERSGEGALVSENGDSGRTPEQVRAEIEQTRQELGETVEALAAKTDVKGQAKQAVHEARATVTEKVADVRHSMTDTAQGVSSSAQERAPRSVADAGAQASRIVRENRPAVIAAGTFLLGVLIGRRRSR
jgi:type IV secretory pathway VirB10-like protein